MLNISDFATHLEFEVLKPTHYTVDFYDGPFNYTGILAEAVTIPGRSIATQERRTFGPQREMPYERLYSGDLDVTFLFAFGGAIRAGQKQIRSDLESWMDKVISQDDIINANREDYTGKMRISVDHPDTNTPAWQMEVDEVFPKTVNPVPLGYAMNDEYLRQSVSFAFRQYKITKE